MTSEDDDDDDDVGLEEELLHQDTDSDAAQSSDSDGLLSVQLLPERRHYQISVNPQWFVINHTAGCYGV